MPGTNCLNPCKNRHRRAIAIARVKGQDACPFRPPPPFPENNEADVTDTMDDLTLCGWRVSTEWPLPELLPWAGEDRAVDITIRLGEVPRELPGTVQTAPLVQVNDAGWVRYTVRNIATFLVKDGRDITIDTPHSPTTPDIALFLLGSVFGFLCHQRGLLPLHASCVAFGERAIAFAGASGMGKSTISACLLAQGAQLVSDDVTVIDIHAPGGPMALPSFPRQKLWRDTLDALNLPAGRRLRGTVEMEKFDRPVGAFFRNAPIRLERICELASHIREEKPRLTLCDGLVAVRMLHRNIYRRRAATMLGFGGRMLQDVASLAKTLSHRTLFMPRGLSKVVATDGELRDLLEEVRP